MQSNQAVFLECIYFICNINTVLCCYTNLHDFCWFHVQPCPAVSVHMSVTQLWHASHFTSFSSCHFSPPQIFHGLPTKLNFIQVKFFSLVTICLTRGIQCCYKAFQLERNATQFVNYENRKTKIGYTVYFLYRLLIILPSQNSINFHELKFHQVMNFKTRPSIIKNYNYKERYKQLSVLKELQISFTTSRRKLISVSYALLKNCTLQAH